VVLDAAFIYYNPFSQEKWLKQAFAHLLNLYINATLHPYTQFFSPCLKNSKCA
jgi:hypothetical protein